MQKLALFLNTHKGVHCLKKSIESARATEIAFVCSYNDATTDDRSFEQIKALCDSNNIDFKIWTRESVFEAEFALAIGWQFLIKGNVEKIVVIHDSLLPKYRGFAPVVTALIRGEKTLGATAFLATNTMDAGPVIAQQSINVEYPAKLWSVIERLSDVYWQLTECVFASVESGLPLPLTVQDESQASYSVWRNEDDFAIDWSTSAEEICRFVDATGYPYKGSCTKMNDSVIRIFDAEVVADLPFEIRQPGKIWAFEEGAPIVVCGTGMIKLKNTEPAMLNKRLRVRFQ